MIDNYRRGPAHPAWRGGNQPCDTCGRPLDRRNATGRCRQCKAETTQHWRRYKGKRVRFHVYLFLTTHGGGPHQCWYCDTFIYDELLVHHKDGDRQNNDLANLAPMHRGCHTKHHHENGDIPAQTPPQWWLR